MLPPLSTMRLYSPLRTSIGDVWMTLSTTSGRGVKKSEEAISGLKKISEARKRSYPTSTEYFCGHKKQTFSRDSESMMAEE